MNCIKEHFTKTLEVKQSKFIAHLLPYHDYDKTLQELKTLHPKARHFVVAYRYLNEFNQIVEHSSDDGEPKGTSGKPSLMVLQGKDIINTAVIIVRYFGGTKLGTGGLVRAYSDAVNLVLDSADILQYIQKIEKKISFEYSNIRVVEYEASVLEVDIVDKVFGDKVLYSLQASKNSMDKLLDILERGVSVVE